ncbi:hypothetical protein DdX_19193 [Ditylenchus destructor]|uniref:Uncharacterized protein n=1 Tax=Ditylenchus destructor TaxID=166010 RepID=A0AAD4MNK9_9BILA|nr:hypothetical protein DdX_19193 [Ditylenchus destructor]
MVKETSLVITNYTVHTLHRLTAGNCEPIFNSQTILQCRTLYMFNPYFSFKDCAALYNVKFIEIQHKNEEDIDLWLQHWQEFLEQPGVKPIVVFNFLCHEIVDNLLDRISKAFSSAVSPNAFKVAFVLYYKSLTEFRETNKTSREILELKKGLPVEYQKENLKLYHNYTLERFSV